MALPDPIDQLTDALADPASVSADGVSVSARSADDQIKLLNYAAMLTAMNKRRRGVRYAQQIPQGPVVGCDRNGDGCGCSPPGW